MTTTPAQSPTSPADPAGAPAHPLYDGLSEAEAARRLTRHGPNRLAEEAPRRWPRIALEAMREPMILLLLVAVGLYFFLGDAAEAAFLLAGALGSVALVVVQEARSERALAALKDLAAPAARVVRGGVERRIPASELVPGDIFLIGEGSRAPADASLVGGDILLADESVLTGESAPVMKHPAVAGGQDASGDSRIFAGTLLVRGQGVACVTQTGAATRLGQIGASLSSIEHGPTRLQQATRAVVANLGVFAFGTAAAVLLLYGIARDDWVTGALASITIAVALIPEEFPIVVTVFLALGSWRLARKKVLVRRAAATETLGSISVLCVDKTGTLTRNRMTLAALWRDGCEWSADRGVPEAPDLRRLLTTAALASAPRPVDPMDRALRAFEGGGEPATPLRSFPLRPDRLAFIQAWPDGAGARLAAKGAPEAIFDLCHMAQPARREMESVVADFAERGLRVLGVASAVAARDDGAEPGAEPFAFEGLVAFEDPVRDDVPPAVALARRAGIAVVMITGDYPATALEIARQAGIDPAGGVLSGDELRRMDDAALREAVARVSVFARISPDQKLRLVEALKANGAVVGMFGDGVNDAPALEAADVGVAMGRRGADVAREAADLVLLDDRFASVVAGVAEGRRIFANLRAALAYVVVVHVPIAGLAVLPLLFGHAPVLFPLQVVLLELVVDPMCTLVFEGRSAERGAMDRPPRPPREPMFGRLRLGVSAAQGLALLCAIFGLHLILLDRGVAEPAARAATLITLVVANFAVAAVLGLARAESPSRLQQLAYASMVLVTLPMLAAAVFVPWLARLFQFAPPSPAATLAAVAVGLGAGLAVGAAALALDARIAVAQARRLSRDT